MHAFRMDGLDVIIESVLAAELGTAHPTWKRFLGCVQVRVAQHAVRSIELRSLAASETREYHCLASMMTTLMRLLLLLLTLVSLQLATTHIAQRACIHCDVCTRAEQHDLVRIVVSNTARAALHAGNDLIAVRE